MFLRRDRLQHINSITHDGKVIVVGTDLDGQIFYTVKQDRFEDTYGKTEVLGWENWNPLDLPNEPDDTSVIRREQDELTVESEPTRFIVRSRYRTHNRSAVAPVQLVSGLGHLYIFRQSDDGTLLVDRFVLDGINNKLVRKLEVRFKRSGKRYEPLQQKGDRADQLTIPDSLDFRDINGNLFYEPTTELSLINQLENGWFSIVLLPTGELDQQRWHIFAYNKQTKKIELFSLQASSDGLFDISDRTVQQPNPEQPDSPRLSRQYGIVRRTLDLADVTVANGFSATRYDEQVEKVISGDETQLLRGAVRVMLVIPTTSVAAAALSFAVGIDGNLAQVAQTPDREPSVLRGNVKEVLLPLDTLDEIQAMGSNPPLRGSIRSIERADGDRVKLTVEQGTQVSDRATVQISQTRDYNGHYTVKKVDANTFLVDANWSGNEIGEWEVIPPEETGLLFDGIITGVEQMPNGVLKVTAPNHGLDTNDEVQISDTRNYDGRYPVKKLSNTQFLIGTRWQPGEAINLKAQSRKRRGITFNGAGDCISLPALPLKSPSPQTSIGETFSAWIFVPTRSAQPQLIVGRSEGGMQLGLKQGKAVLSVSLNQWQQQIEDPTPVPEGQWVHYAGIFSYDAKTQAPTLVLCRNGVAVAQQSVERAALMFDGHDDFVQVQDAPALNPQQALTVEAWVYPTTWAGERRILQKGSNNNQYRLLSKGNRLVFEVIGVTNGRIDAPLPELNQWHHIAGVYDAATQTLQLVVNGALQSKKVASGLINRTADPLFIGTKFSASPVSDRFQGQISEVRLWNRALSVDDLISLRDQPFDDLQQRYPERVSATLVGYWNFAGGSVVDQSSAKTEGMAHGNPRFITPPSVDHIEWNAPFQIGGVHEVANQPAKDFFAGKIADVQVWSTARSPQVIKDSMHLQLTGRESHLVGYWRLGGILGNQVLDFSVAGHHGTVVGNPYVSAVSLRRRLSDGVTPVVRYTNSDLIAVTQGATYTEAFEFRLISTATTRPEQPFQMTYWGKTNHQAESRIKFEGQPTVITELQNGWYAASCTVTIPDEVKLMRAFELSHLEGDWSQLEIRQHQMQIVSNTITQVEYSDRLSLPILHNNNAAAEELLSQLTPKEQQHAALQVERKEIEDMLALLLSNGLAIQLAAQEEKVRQLRTETENLYAIYARESQNPFNKICRFISRGTGRSLDSTTAGTLYSKPRDPDNSYQQWSVRPVDAGYCLLVNQATGRVADSTTKGKAYTKTYEAGNTYQHWEMRKRSDGFYTVINRQTGRVLDGSGDGDVYTSSYGENNWYQQWMVLTTDVANNTVVDDTKRNWEAKLAVLQHEERVLAQYRELVANADARRQALQLRLYGDPTQNIEGVIPALDRLQHEINQINTEFLNVVKDAEAIAMSELVPNRTGLTGALLGFVRPSSAMNAIETCEGNVQLSYFDDRGRMRTTRFDATADTQNTEFGQWIPDAVRPCLIFDKDDSRLILATPNATNDSVSLSQPDVIQTYTTPNPIQLPAQWTVEAWFSHPLPEFMSTLQSEPLTYNTLFSNLEGSVSPVVASIATGVTNDNQPVSQKRLGALIDHVFYDSGFNLEQLSPGWHHLTVVRTEQSLTYYIDGNEVGDAIAQLQAQISTAQAAKKTALEAQLKAQLDLANQRLSAEVYTIGNSIEGKQQFGKLAEVRLWSAALTGDEIAVNSKTLLSGHEPNLLAYFPMRDSIADPIRDYSGNGYNGIGFNTSLFACAAPIGHLGHSVMQFDGVNDVVKRTLPARSSAETTIECWFKTRSANAALFGLAPTGQPDHPFWLGNTDFGVSIWQGFLQVYKAGSGVLTKFGLNLNDDRWHHIAFTLNRETPNSFLPDGKEFDNKVYLDGALLTDWQTEVYGMAKERVLSIGSIAGNTPGNPNAPARFFQGAIAEFRVWDRVRSAEDIASTFRRKLTGKEANLIGYWPLEQILTDTAEKTAKPNQKTLDLTGKYPASVGGAILALDYNFPLAQHQALLCAEYATIGVSPTQTKVAMMRRFFAMPSPSGVTLLADKRVEHLELKWVGNTQIKPTLLGYIEGAPPVPSENMTESSDYNGATSVELVTTEDLAFSWNRDQDAGLGTSLSGFIGSSSENFQISPTTQVTKIESHKAGFVFDVATGYSFLNKSTVAAESGVSISDKLELRGTSESEPRFPYLGQRFIPKNVGYAVVVSGLADVYITRLKRSKRMVSYQVVPNEDIPLDINTITFLINPTYICNGSLDGQIGTNPGSDRFFSHVPEMRAQFGSSYPASYYRLKEAYALKQRIDQQDKDRETYFENFNSRLVDQDSVNRQIDGSGATTLTGDRNGANSPSLSASGLKEQSQQLKKEQEAKRTEIERKVQGQDQQVHATASFAGWQQKMSQLQVQAGKHNIVNTYVWDADGGLRAESQQFANTVEHTIGASFSLDAAFGGTGEFELGLGGLVDVELTGLATVHLTQTMTKSETRSRGFSLNIDLNGVESVGVTDANDYPLVPGEKVNRYRLMSFYLEGSTEHFQDFFGYVVDPEWLGSNSEEARALRQLATGNHKPWRVMHRVTYVERPALMGFGRDLRPLATSQSPETTNLLTRLDSLEKENQALADKLDQILDLLQK